jgi:protein LTV1
VFVQNHGAFSEDVAQLLTDSAGAAEATAPHETGQNDLEDSAIARAKALEAAERYACTGNDSDSDGGDADADRDVPQLLARRPVQDDCESVLSRCSHLFNHPGQINDVKDSSKRKPGSSSSGMGVATSAGLIQLSSKTGLPKVLAPASQGLASVHEHSSDSGAAAQEWQEKVNLGEARGRCETAEEKKARKAAVKEGKRANRQRKKESREVFAAAKTSMQQHVASNSHAQRTVLHIV